MIKMTERQWLIMGACALELIIWAILAMACPWS